MIGRTLGHYEVVERLGEGGTGVVYKARDIHLDRFVEFSDRSTYALGFLGAAYAAAGREGEARRLLAELLDPTRRAYTPAIAVAHVCLGLGETDRAFQWLDKAVEECEPRTLWLKPSQLYEPYRSDPRYLALLRKMNLE